jgi:hypothetical protein
MNISRAVATGPSEARNPLSAATDRVWVVARKDIRDLVSGKFYIYLIFICLICLPYFDSARNAVNELSKQGMSASDVRLAAQSFLDTMAYTLPVMLAMLLCSVFASYAILMDKTKRAFESLLATPLSLKQIWMGKTIGVALPGGDTHDRPGHHRPRGRERRRAYSSSHRECPGDQSDTGVSGGNADQSSSTHHDQP